jgi:hypothetical protein
VDAVQAREREEDARERAVLGREGLSVQDRVLADLEAEEGSSCGGL